MANRLVCFQIVVPVVAAAFVHPSLKWRQSTTLQAQSTISRASAIMMPLTEVEWRPRMERYVRSGQWQRAISLLGTVQDAGGEVSSGGYQAVLTACARADPPAWRAALQVLEECCDAKATTERVYGAAIHACRTEWRVAFDLLQRMRKEHADGPINLVASTAVIKALGTAGEWRRALALFHETVGSGDDDDEASRAWAEAGDVGLPLVHATMMACAEAGRADEVLELLAFVRPNARRDADEAIDHALAVAYANAQRPADALRVLDERREAGLAVSLNTYHALLRASRLSDTPSASITCFEHLLRSGLVPSDASYVLGLAPALARDASWRPALSTIASLLRAHEPSPRVPPAVADRFGCHIR
jgi:hypothetical protein